MAKFANHMEKIAGGVAEGYQKMEKVVICAYQKVENAFVNTFLVKEGETAKDAKARMAEETKARDAARKAMIEKSQPQGR